MEVGEEGSERYWGQLRLEGDVIEVEMESLGEALEGDFEGISVRAMGWLD